MGARDIGRILGTCIALAAAVLLLAARAAGARTHGAVQRDPVIFVHGFEGSGSQFDSQAMASPRRRAHSR